MVEGGRGSTGAHSPGLVVAFICCRPWGVFVSKGTHRLWGSLSSGGGALSLSVGGVLYVCA